ncbi:kinase-like domain-containing protein [Aspergillus filifer]
MVEYEAASETDRTIFSQASSRADDLDTQLVIPPPPIPEVDVGLTPFICPYCCQTVTVKNIHDDWAYHVYSDLRPYICTFGGCQDADRLYDSYTEWSEHESQFHRCEWACSLCSHISDTESSFSVHLEASHLKELSRDQLHTVLKISRRPTNASQQCPLCNKLPITDPKKFQKHLARHLRQLCLDVLPMDESIARTDPDHPEGSASSERTSDFDGIVGSPSETALLTFRNKLRINIVPFSMAEGRGFVPISIIKELVHGNAQNILREQNIVNSEQLPSVAETIEKHAPKLFTLLVNLEKESDIVRFLAEGITDQSLPVRDGAQGGLELFTKQGRPMQTIKQWDDWVVKAFITMQYQVLSPVFQRGRHYVLDEEQVLPFVDQDFESNYRPPTTEDYTEVRRAHIHQHHYEFGYSTRRGKALAVVLKGRPQVAGVNREMRILRDLSSSVHPNLIDLLFTYEKNDLSYVVIPSADANLREYWIMNSNSELSGVLLGWSIGQMAGLADALALFHKFHSATLNVTRYGRHGDIKAENILWFRDSHLLKIAGLQLSNDKGRKMKDSINPDEVIAPPTYSPPDRHRELLISRKWDIWSLGCLYLEFITFLVLGNDAIVEFSNERLDTSGEDPALRTDDFYTSNWQDVKPSVFSWINRLRENSRCTNALCDVLTLIMAKMIVIEPEERASAAQVHSELRTIHDRATSSSYYLLDSGSEPEGRPIRGKTSSFLNVSSIQSRRDEPGRRRNNFARAFRNFLRI